MLQRPKPLFEVPGRTLFASWANYDVTPDGQQFVFVQPAEEAGIRVVPNWFKELKERVPIP